MPRTRRGRRVIRTPQAGDQLINVILVIVLAASIGFIGTDVTAEIDSNTDRLDGDTITVTNESAGNVTFDSNGNYFYEVDKNGSSDVASFNDDETVFNTTDDSQLTEATDYEWHTTNGTLQLINTADVDNNTEQYVITYTYDEITTNFGDAQNDISAGFADAMSLTDIVFIVLLFGVILSVLLAFRMRT